MTGYDVVIIGGGPAGCTAVLYSARAGLRTLLIERGVVGGQIANASLVENYPGFPQGISGAELAALMHQQAFAEPKVEFVWGSVVDEIVGDTSVRGLNLLHVKTGRRSVLDVNGVFVAVGVSPNSQAFSNLLKCDDDGYIVTDEKMATSSPGVFAAGDIRRNSPRQVSTAVGDGATAAMSAFKFLKEGR